MRDRLINNTLWIALALGLALLGWLALRPSGVSATPDDAPVEGVTPTSAPLFDGGSAEPLPTTATVVFVTVPFVTATVTWGRKLLGKITPGKPLVVVRPRDSGPLDVMVRASGYLPVQTRAHTFSDTRVLVKLTPLDKKNELLGYRVPIDAGSDGAMPWEQGFAGDAGAPDASAFQVVPTSPILLPQPAPQVFDAGFNR